jgi:hypothetical protein
MTDAFRTAVVLEQWNALLRGESSMLYRRSRQNSEILAVLPLFMAGLVGCGAEAQSSGESIETTENALRSDQVKIEPGPAGTGLAYTFCSNENTPCNIGSTTRYVAFGIDGHFRFAKMVSNFNCDRATFGGDPYPGHAKKCYFSDYTPVVDEGSFIANGSGNYAFGADGKFLFKTVSSPQGFSCDRATFGGDPAQGVAKTCYRAVPFFNYIASEGDTNIDLEPFDHGYPVNLAYGANGGFVFAAHDFSHSSHFDCTTAEFNIDPAEHVHKSCYVFGPIGIASEGASYSMQLGNVAVFGSSHNGLFLDSSAPQGTCSAAFFGGDPDPFYLKYCSRVF